MRRIAVGLAVLLALLAAAAAGFDRDVLFDVRPAPYAASIRLFNEGARDLDIDLVEPDGAIPYLLPGPADPWAGGTAHTLRFRLGAVPRPVVLRLHAVETHHAAPPRLTLRLDSGSGSSRWVSCRPTSPITASSSAGSSSAPGSGHGHSRP